MARPGLALPLTLAIVLVTTAAAYQPSLDWRALDDAVRLGQTGIERDRRAFHAPYRLPAAGGLVDAIEVVTPFRRVVLEAQTRTRRGLRLFGQREALQLLAEAGSGLTLYAEITFHPLNTYVSVPGYQLRLVPPAGSSPPIEARQLARWARYGARVEGAPVPLAPPPDLPAAGEPILGATVVAEFDSALLDTGAAYDAVVSDAGRTLATVRVNLGGLR